jgi:hypothetical protein
MKRFAIVFCFVVLTSALVAGPAVAASTTTTTGAPGTALTHVTIPSAGISLGYPAGWTATQYTGLSKAAQKKIKKLNPNLASNIAAAQSLKNAKLYAIDQTQPGGFSDNINVLVQSSGGAPSSLDDFRSYVEAQYQALGATLNNASTTKIGNRKSYVANALLPLKVDANTTVNAYITQVLVPNRDGATLMTLTTSDDDAGHAITDQVVASMKLARAS